MKNQQSGETDGEENKSEDSSDAKSTRMEITNTAPGTLAPHEINEGGFQMVSPRKAAKAPRHEASPSIEDTNRYQNLAIKEAEKMHPATISISPLCFLIDFLIF
ncbi:hypothetical protein AVEN_252265-1 [Araneus ventricosus]|uniref:Uncharacterized protein n=1 Tax=Araneus ventricosus TaxID=182803 RepID=A0A4Y2RGQ1_ARAVE|nr:hypothetical protein AVEN_252265-1 [Araneus ventricosus]